MRLVSILVSVFVFSLWEGKADSFMWLERMDSVVVDKGRENVIIPVEQGAHFSFKGIPIDGSRYEFGKALESKGYRKVTDFIYSGSFAGCDNSAVILREGAGNVCSVSVFFPCRENWASVKEQYLTLKERLIYKYILSPAVVREHLNPKFGEGSGMEKWGFENGSSVYTSLFDFKSGMIVLSILDDKESDGLMVCIEYIDRLNHIKKENADLEDL